MKTLKDYADVILTPKPIKIEKTSELMDRFNTIAESIYNCPFRNYNGRSYENVFHSVEQMVLEYALAQVTGMQMNPLEFDHTDRFSYAYDVFDPENGKTFECKRWSKKYFTFKPPSIETMLKNKDIIDYFVSGKLHQTDSVYNVRFFWVCEAKNFRRYCTMSGFSKDFYYNHKSAALDGHAFYREAV